MNARARARALSSAAFALALTAPSIASAKPPAGAVVVSGADAQTRGVITATVLAVVNEAGWQLVPSRFETFEVEKIVACTGDDRPWSCIASNNVDHGAEKLVVVQAKSERTDAGPRLTITAKLVAADGSASLTATEVCAQCNDDALAAMAKQLATRLIAQVQALAPQPPHGDGHDHDGDHGDDAAAHRQKMYAGIVGGVGLVAVGVGSYVSWTADDNDVGVRHKYRYSGPGLAVAGVGAAAIGVGVYLWFRHPAHDSAPVVTVVPGGGMAGWTRSF